jgi:hypothetical protein
MTLPKPPEGPTVAVLLPVRALEGGEVPVVRRRACRPRRVEKAPSVSEAEYHRVVSEQAGRAIENDSVVTATSTNDTLKVLDAAMEATAIESAALHFDRIQATSQGKAEAAMISSRRVQALYQLAALVVERHHLRAADPEPTPAVVEKLKTIFFSIVGEVLDETVPNDLAERFRATLDKKLTVASASTATPATSGTTT